MTPLEIAVQLEAAFTDLQSSARPERAGKVANLERLIQDATSADPRTAHRAASFLEHCRKYALEDQSEKDEKHHRYFAEVDVGLVVGTLRGPRK